MPHRASAGTGSSPRGSRSTRVALIASFRSVRLPFVSSQESPMHLPDRAVFSADKFYVVLSGKANFVVGERTVAAGPGDLILAPAGVPHGVAHAETRTIVLVAIA